ncbi:MAG: hypothetical protein ABJG78_14185 [Cyclobacteriaceae bacterium]
MKKILYVSLSLSLFLTSCSSDDDPSVSPIVGLWVLDRITVSDPPAGYQFAINTTPTSIYGETSYEIEFFADNTYERIVRTANRFEDDGTWTLNGDELDLDQENANIEGLPVTFDVDGDIDERGMTLITKDGWLAWPPLIVNDPVALDTADTQEKLQALFAEYGELVTSTFTLDFELDN